MRHALLALCLICTPLLVTAASDEPAFLEQVLALNKQYEPLFKAHALRAELGEAPAASDALLAAFPSANRSPALQFVLGNVLYDYSPALSRPLHVAAATALPDNAAAQLEAGLQAHRADDCAAAIPYYQAVVGLHAEASGAQALLAECLVRTGALEAALAAWQAANQPRHHIAIEEAIASVHGPLAPAQRRSELLVKVRNKDPQAAQALLLLDLNYDRNWWNAKVNQDALSADLALCAQLFGENSDTYQQMAGYVAVKTKTKPLEQMLKDTRLLLGTNAQLPLPGEMGKRLFGNVFDAKLLSPQQAYAQFGPALQARITANNDISALEVLTFMVLSAKPDGVPALDRLGWRRYQLPAFAASYLLGLARSNNGKLPLDNAEVQQIGKAFARDTQVASQLLRAAAQQGLGKSQLLPYLSTAISAEFAEPQGGIGPYDSYLLKAYFLLLKETL